MCACAKLLQSCLTLGDPMDCSPPGSFVHWDSSGKNTRGGFPCPPPEDLLDPGMEPASLVSHALASGFFTPSAAWEAHLWFVAFCSYRVLVYNQVKAGTNTEATPVVGRETKTKPIVDDPGPSLWTSPPGGCPLLPLCSLFLDSAPLQCRVPALQTL